MTALALVDPGDTVATAGAAVPDRASFVLFYQREYAAVRSLAYVLSGRSDFAEDLVQDAFLIAYRRWSRIGAYDRPGSFVRRVVANRAVSQHRRLAAEGRARARLALRVAPAEEPVELADPEFWAALRTLPGRQAQVLALRYLEDRSTEEIAAILGCAVPTVRVHLHRGRLALAALLAGTEGS